MLSFEDLTDYRIEEQEKMSKCYRENSFHKYFDDHYSKLDHPISHGITGPGLSVWSQIPLSGSLIIGLSPFPAEIYEEQIGIKTREIPEMVEFAKQTNRLHFFLTDMPEKYDGLDFLSSVLEEFHPPIDFVPYADKSEYEKYKSFKREFCEESHLTSPKTIRTEISFSGGGKPKTTVIDLDDDATFTYYDNLSRAYAHLRYFNFINSYDDLRGSTVYTYNSYDYIEKKISLLNDFLIPIKTRPIKTINIFELDQLVQASQVLGMNYIQDDTNVVELGSKFLDQFAFCPASSQECQKVIDRYKDADLPGVYDALYHSVVMKNSRKIIEQGENLSEAFDNLWKDPGSIRLKKIGFDTVPLILGIIGEHLQDTTSLGVFCKLISQTYEAHKTLSPKMNNDLLEFFAKSITDPYMVTIYDFKKKYNFEECL